MSEWKLPHRGNVIKFSGRSYGTQQALHKEKEKNWQTDSWLGGTLQHGRLSWPPKGKKKAFHSSACMHECATQVRRSSVQDHLPTEPLQEEGDIVTWDKCRRREMKTWECAWIHDEVRKAAAPRRMRVTAEGKMKVAHTSPILVDFTEVAW